MSEKTQEEIQKAIDGLVDQALNTSEQPEVTAEAPAVPVETVAKAKNPFEAMKEEKEDKDDKEDPKADKKADKKDPKKEDKKEDKKDLKKMKKSLDELADHLTDDELELVKAWREESEDEEEIVEAPVAVAPAMNFEEITKSIRSIVATEVETLRKSLTDKDDLIKGLNDKIEKISKQPAYDKRSLETLEPIQKGGEEQPIQKSQVLDKMLQLQMAGQGVRSTHVAEFESTGNISDPIIKSLVMKSFTK